MNISGLINQLERHGIWFSIGDTGNLRINSKQPLNDVKRQYLKEHKSELISHLLGDKFQAIGRTHDETAQTPSHDERAFTGRTMKPVKIDEIVEAAEERAAIMEYEGSLPRADAEKHAIEAHIKPYLFKCTDGGGIFRTQCETIEEARKALENRFGNKLIKVDPMH